MNYRIVFTPESEEQLAALYGHIATATSPDIAASIYRGHRDLLREPTHLQILCCPIDFHYWVWERGTARRVGRGRSPFPGGRLREAVGRGWGGGSPREGIFPKFMTCDGLIHSLWIFSALKIL